MATATTSSEQASKAKPEMSLLEEDDEFEEFPVKAWEEKDEDSTDINQWEDNWDDDIVDDDFSKQLRAELEKVPQSMHQ